MQEPKKHEGREKKIHMNPTIRIQSAMTPNLKTRVPCYVSYTIALFFLEPHDSKSKKNRCLKRNGVDSLKASWFFLSCSSISVMWELGWGKLNMYQVLTLCWAPGYVLKATWPLCSWSSNWRNKQIGRQVFHSTRTWPQKSRDFGTAEERCPKEPWVWGDQRKRGIFG